jgi:hypothetical protein
MLALLPLLISIVPEIAHWIAGDTAGTVAQKVADVAQTVLGTTDPAAAATLLADQGKVSDLRIALAKIGADVERAKLDAQTAAITAALADTANARQQTVDLAKAGSSISWGAPVVSVVVLVTFGLVLVMAFTRPIPPGSEALLNVVIGSLATMASGVVGYWVGSSHGSQAKDALLAASAPVGSIVKGPLS